MLHKIVDITISDLEDETPAVITEDGFREFLRAVYNGELWRGFSK